MSRDDFKPERYISIQFERDGWRVVIEAIEIYIESAHLDIDQLRESLKVYDTVKDYLAKVDDEKNSL